MAAARGILLKCNHSMLAEYGSHIQLNKHWAHSLLKRMKFVQRKATTSKSKHTVADFTQLKKVFLADVAAIVTMEEIPPELVLNWDQTGIKLVSCSSLRNREKRGWKWLGLMTNAKSLLSSVAVCLETSYMCSWCTRERHPAVILAFPSNQADTSRTLPTIGQQKRQCCST